MNGSKRRRPRGKKMNGKKSWSKPESAKGRIEKSPCRKKHACPQHRNTKKVHKPKLTQ